MTARLSPDWRGAISLCVTEDRERGGMGIQEAKVPASWPSFCCCIEPRTFLRLNEEGWLVRVLRGVLLRKEETDRNQRV